MLRNRYPIKDTNFSYIYSFIYIFSIQLSSKIISWRYNDRKREKDINSDIPFKDIYVPFTT